MRERYQIGEQGGQAFIDCATCGSRSFHPRDVIEAYCGRCHVFHADAEHAERFAFGAMTHTSLAPPLTSADLARIAEQLEPPQRRLVWVPAGAWDQFRTALGALGVRNADFAGQLGSVWVFGGIEVREEGSGGRVEVGDFVFDPSDGLLHEVLHTWSEPQP